MHETESTATVKKIYWEKIYGYFFGRYFGIFSGCQRRNDETSKDSIFS